MMNFWLGLQFCQAFSQQFWGILTFFPSTTGFVSGFRSKSSLKSTGCLKIGHPKKDQPVSFSLYRAIAAGYANRVYPGVFFRWKPLEGSIFSENQIDWVKLWQLFGVLQIFHDINPVTAHWYPIPLSRSLKLAHCGPFSAVKTTTKIYKAYA